MKYSQIAAIIIKEVLQKACRYFTISILVYNLILGSLHMNWVVTLIGATFNITNSMRPVIVLIFAAASLLASLATQVFKITKIPVFSRHIAFFIIIYFTFIFVVIPLSPGQTSPNATFILSIVFIIIYLIIFGIYMGIKAVKNTMKNKKLDYEEVYKEAK